MGNSRIIILSMAIPLVANPASAAWLGRIFLIVQWFSEIRVFLSLQTTKSTAKRPGNHTKQSR